MFHVANLESCSHRMRSFRYVARCVIASLLSAVLIFSLAGCSKSDPTVSDRTKSRVVVQINDTNCKEAGGGTETALDGEIGDTDTNAKKTYDVLKEMGYSDENIAGVLGNWATESGIDPSGVEGIFDEPFQLGEKKKSAMDDHQNYTLNTLFPGYANQGQEINEKAYIGEDGTYYPGIGLAGFTGPACTRLLAYAKKYNTAWYSFDLQLSYSIVEGDEGYGRSDFWKGWAAEASPESAAETFLAKYEGCPGQMLDKRQTLAREWYEKIKTWSPDSSYAKSILNMGKGGSLPSPSGNSSSSSRSSVNSSTGELIGSDVAEQCWNFLKALGMSDEAAAGTMGNFEAESGMNPANIQGNGAGPAAGLYQMEKYQVEDSRWGRMQAHAASKGKEWTDLGSQLEFLEQDAPAQFESYTGKTYTYPNGTETWWPTAMTWDEFKKQSDIDQATEIFMRVFERPSVPHLDRRKASAREYYERFKGTGATEQSETSEECEEDGKQKFGSSGITNGDEYIQFQGTHYDNGQEGGGTDEGARGSACGATSFTIGVNMLLGEVHRFCGVETWHAMDCDSTTIGWGSDKGQKWLEQQKLTNEIEITGNNSLSSREDLLKALQEGNVAVVSSAGNVFKNKDGSIRHSNGHYILFYKYENGKFYANDCGNRNAGGGVEYSEQDVDNYFNSPQRNGGGSLVFKRK